LSDLVFLDHAAGSPLRPEVAAAMVEATAGLPPNPSGAHRLARQIRGVLEDARDRVAAIVGVTPREVVFTAGGTESCNVALASTPSATGIFVSAIEHAAVREPARTRAATIGMPLGVLRVTPDGTLDVDRALEQVTAGSLVSVMAANNETGAVQPVFELLSALGDRRTQIVVHSDAIAGAATEDLSALVAACDLVSVAAHKLGGPPGGGLLVARRSTTLSPILFGGGQEQGARPGTQDVAAAVGLAAALEAAAADRLDGSIDAMEARRDRLESGLMALSGVTVTAQGAPRLAGHCHVTIEGVRSEEILVLLDRAGICAAAGAACASGAPQASHVLVAMGIDERRARGSLRLTLAPSTTDADIDAALLAAESALNHLRR